MSGLWFLAPFPYDRVGYFYRTHRLSHNLGFTRQTGPRKRSALPTRPLPSSPAAISPSQPDPLDLIEADLVLATVIELGGASAGMIGHGSGVLQGTAVLQIGGDPGRPKTVISQLGRDPGRCGPPADHGVGVGLG